MSKAESAFAADMFQALLGLALESGAGAFARAVEQEDAGLVSYVARYDVMFAIWRDPQAGFGIMPVSGWDVFRETMAGNRHKDLRSTALPAVNREHATKLLARFGSLDWLKDFESPCCAMSQQGDDSVIPFPIFKPRRLASD